MNVAIVQNNIVEAVTDLSEEQVQSYATRYQAVIDISGASPVPKAGWTWNGLKFLPPASYDTVKYIQETIYIPAKTFGRDLLNRFVSENIAMGITQAGKTRMIGEAGRDLEFWLSAGSLYESLTEIELLRSKMTPEQAPFITNQRLDALKLEVMKYLGLA